MILNFAGMFSQLVGTCYSNSATYQATFWTFFLFSYFCAILYFESSADIFKILSAVGTSNSLEDSWHILHVSSSSLQFSSFQTCKNWSPLKHWIWSEVQALWGAGGRGPLTSKNNLGAFVHHPERFIYSSGISFKKHSCIYFLHILAHYVNVQVGKCGP